MTSREQFEEEMSGKYEWFSYAIACADFCGDDDDGYYVGGDYLYHGNSCSEALFWLWRGWQASRAAIEIELPEPCSPGDFCVDIPAQAHHEVIEAIEMAGLKVK